MECFDARNVVPRLIDLHVKRRIGAINCITDYLVSRKLKGKCRAIRTLLAMRSRITIIYHKKVRCRIWFRFVHFVRMESK
jgi:hypothetical protein